jgi:predicted secreted protein
MGKINGTELLIYVDNVAVGGTRTCTFSTNQDLPDATTKDSGGWAEHIKGLRDWSISFDGLYDPTLNYGYKELYELISDRTQVVTMKLQFNAGLGNAAVVVAGSVSLDSLELTADMEDVIAWSGNAVGNGAPTVTILDGSGS